MRSQCDCTPLAIIVIETAMIMAGPISPRSRLQVKNYEVGSIFAEARITGTSRKSFGSSFSGTCLDPQRFSWNSQLDSGKRNSESKISD